MGNPNAISLLIIPAKSPVKLVYSGLFTATLLNFFTGDELFDDKPQSVPARIMARLL
jgi:hypothetical protein